MAYVPGLSTIGAEFAYAFEATAGTKPTAFAKIERCNAIDGITLENEQIDASALEDASTKYVAGRSDPGGTWNVSFNYQDEIQTTLSTLISDWTTTYKPAGKALWIEVYHPNLTNGFFVKVEPPSEIPMPSWDQNSLQVLEFPFTIVSYEGVATAIIPT